MYKNIKNTNIINIGSRCQKDSKMNSEKQIMLVREMNTKDRLVVRNVCEL